MFFSHSLSKMPMNSLGLDSGSALEGDNISEVFSSLGSLHALGSPPVWMDFLRADGRIHTS